ncbi:O-acetyl-ADP-ribose deacetylase (regulator of RNase III) [Methylohalomonas lacus]|uniref:O-acetyl-ADP-ribose deacetylase (Regulator of RNase III) n=1 Tax=Methylohalomonas lacus TaxID=398773 RepID=A0AAE3HNQ2_9GAMM|nr:macro domain-containing protein [Methylohalomonas lacus]MCS3904052.1 O-acetyl-ADP-ribose deacetylase (regulator of RNase III) [Methylohalomonas lacus]
MSATASRTIEHVTIECCQGDITRQPDMDAVVNAANAELMPGGGVAGAIHRAAGRGLAEECRPQAPIRPGEAVITGGHDLPNRHIIHCLGPIYGVDRPEADLLARCYHNALSLAEANALTRIAFPAISAGAFGYPLEPAAEVALSSVRQFGGDDMRTFQNLRHIRFVLFSAADRDAFSAALHRLAG